MRSASSVAAVWGSQRPIAWGNRHRRRTIAPCSFRATPMYPRRAQPAKDGRSKHGSDISHRVHHQLCNHGRKRHPDVSAGGDGAPAPHAWRRRVQAARHPRCPGGHPVGDGDGFRVPVVHHRLAGPLPCHTGECYNSQDAWSGRCIAPLFLVHVPVWAQSWYIAAFPHSDNRGVGVILYFFYW